MLRRLVTLITQLAKELSNKGVLKHQAENINQAAKKFMEENERLKRVFKFFFLKTGVNVFGIPKGWCIFFSLKKSIFLLYKQKMPMNNSILQYDCSRSILLSLDL